MRRTKEEAEDTRKQLLEAAKKVFAAKGFGATRLSDIAQEAGMTRGAIYWHFKDKKEMLLTISKEEVDPFFEIVFKILGESLSPLQKIHKVLTTMLQKLVNDESFLCSVNLSFIELNLRNDIPEIKEYMHRRGEDVRRIFENLIENGIKAGEFRKADPSAITNMVFALISGYILMAEEGTINIDLQPEVVIDALLNGIKK